MWDLKHNQIRAIGTVSGVSLSPIVALSDRCHAAYDHSWDYRAAQLSFLEVLQQADGNRLYNVLSQCPYHIDTLMQLSEMQTQQGDLGTSFVLLFETFSS